LKHGGFCRESWANASVQSSCRSANCAA
jgi:hypothetical protein